MAYIHEHPRWPELTWDDRALALPLAQVRLAQIRLLARLRTLGLDSEDQANLATLTSDVVKTSAIEGESLDYDEVRSSLARRLGLDIAGLPHPSRHVEGIVQVHLEATQNFEAPLSADRLFSWHAALFPTGRSGLAKITVGQWRTPASGIMQVVSGPVGRQRVHFEAPPADRLDSEMNQFMDWFNQPLSMDPLVKSGVAHLWFVTIHPFDDGNGRIARAIADMALARADGTSKRFYSMTAQIASERNVYYQRLESTQGASLDITGWLTWYLACLGRALERSDPTIDAVLFKGQMWQAINRQPVHDRQRLILNAMLGDWRGFMSTSKYATMAKCSPDTALRDIRELVDRHILIQNSSGGRSTSYRLGDPATITPR